MCSVVGYKRWLVCCDVNVFAHSSCSFFFPIGCMSCLWAVKGASRVKKDVWQVTWFRLVYEKKESTTCETRLLRNQSLLTVWKGCKPNNTRVFNAEFSLYSVLLPDLATIPQLMTSVPLTTFWQFSNVFRAWHRMAWLRTVWWVCWHHCECYEIYASESDVSAQSADLTLKFENPRTTLVWHQLHNKVVLVSTKKNPATARNFA